MSKTVAVIGGGVAGIESAKYLNNLGYKVLLFEKESTLGGNVLKWDRLFPNQRHAKEVIDTLTSNIDGITVYTSSQILQITRQGNQFTLTQNGSIHTADSIILTTGFNLFPAEKKEEYGYGIFENVITSAQLELMFKNYGKPQTSSGEEPSRVAIIHCVGSRDEKVNRPYCSKVCCVTAVKQAIEIKEVLPHCDVFCFYMDLRMFGSGYEELYKKAQLLGVNFIRGRLSETSEVDGSRILVKAEDTLSSRPLKMTVDMVVLMVGMSPNTDNNDLFNHLGINLNPDGFVQVQDFHTEPNGTNIPGVFVAGACTGPNNITDSVLTGRSAAVNAHSFLTNQ